jgi:uncharacterized membrane protein YgcG
MRRSGWLFLVLLTVFFLNPVVAKADDADWRINRFHSDLAVQSDGRVKVVETIEVNFGAVKHGIYRDIPYIYQNPGQADTYTTIAILTVQQDGQDEPYELSQQDGYEEVKIGQANKTITGVHHYVLTYIATGILRVLSGYDELYWNVTGLNWPVPIDQASATVSLPRQGILQTACYQGETHNTDSCQMLATNPLEARFSATRPLNAGQNLTVSVGYTKGIVPILSVSRPKTATQKVMEALATPLFEMEMALSLLIGLAIPVGLWWRKGRDWSWREPGMLQSQQAASLQRQDSPIVVEFTPPLDLRPAQMGLLLDERVNTLDVSSTMVDLACRGYITITELAKTWLLGSKDYQLDRTDTSAGDLLAYEQLLLTRLFESKKSLKLSSLKDTFYSKLQEVQKLVYQDLMDRKYFVANPQTVRNWYRGIGVTVAVISGWILVYALSQAIVGLLPVLVAPLAAGVGLALFASAMPQRTALGSEMRHRALGYKLFVSTAEQYQQQFFEKNNLFNQVLPYAMVFGLTHKFAQAMKVIGYVPAQPGWYVGVTPFNVLAFGSGMDSMSRAFSSTMASAPSSSGSGGGGFSGGGFGGGGGGSW